MTDVPESGILDTCVLIDLPDLDTKALPTHSVITAVTMAELQQGVAMATDPVERAKRTESLQDAVVYFDVIPFDAEAAARFGTLAALTVANGRNPKPRRMDLMIAAVASVLNVPLFTRNVADFNGLGEAVEVHPI